MQQDDGLIVKLGGGYSLKRIQTITLCVILIAISITVVLFASLDTSDYNMSKNSISEAINMGVAKEDIRNGQIISTSTYKEVTLIFFEKGNSIGVAYVNGLNEWERNEPLFAFEDDLAVSDIIVHLEVDETTIPIILGVVRDDSIDKVEITNLTDESIDEVWVRSNTDSLFFHYILPNRNMIYELLTTEKEK